MILLIYFLSLFLSFLFIFFICNMKVKKAKTQNKLYYITCTWLQGQISKQTLKRERIELTLFHLKQKDWTKISKSKRENLHLLTTTTAMEIQGQDLSFITIIFFTTKGELSIGYGHSPSSAKLGGGAPVSYHPTIFLPVLF